MRYARTAIFVVAASTIALAASNSTASQTPNIKVQVARTCMDPNNVLLVYYNILQQAGPKTWIPVQDTGFSENAQFVYTDRPGGENVRRTTTQVRVVLSRSGHDYYSDFVTPGGTCE